MSFDKITAYSSGVFHFRSEKLPDHIKLKLRSYATQSGWKISPFTVIRVTCNEILRSNEIVNSLKAKFQASSHLLSPVFQTQIKDSNSIHILLIRPETLNGKIQRIFTNKTDIFQDFAQFIEAAISQYFSSTPNQSNIHNAEFDFLLTAVISPALSGISYSDGSNALIEVGFGQMIGKGEVNTSTYQMQDGKNIYSQETMQTQMISIIDGKIHKPDINQIPKLTLHQLQNITQLTAQFNEVSKGCFSVEWFLTPEGDLYFHDAMPEMKSLIATHIKSRAKLSWENALSQKNQVEDKQAVILYPGEIEGVIVHQTIQQSQENILNFHHLDQNAGDNEGPLSRIFVCDHPSLKYRPLMKPGCGFIFREGSPLCHLANLLREAKIPSCISHLLVDHANFEEGLLNCIIENIGTINYEEYRANLERFQDKINKAPLCLESVKPPINSFILGGKIQNTNYLKWLKKRIPHSLIISSADLEFLHQDKSLLEEAIHKSFPKFALDPSLLLICRSSAENEDSIHSSASGFYESVPKIGDFSSLHTALGLLKNSGTNGKMNLLIQEWIQPLIGGIVFTKNPAILSDNDELYFDFHYESTDATTSGCAKSNLIHLPFQAFNDIASVRIALKRQFSHQNQTADQFKESFFNGFIAFLQECIELGRTLQIPLDIEFVCTHQFDFYFLQMRPIIYQQ